MNIKKYRIHALQAKTYQGFLEDIFMPNTDDLKKFYEKIKQKQKAVHHAKQEKDFDETCMWLGL